MQQEQQPQERGTIVATSQKREQSGKTEPKNMGKWKVKAEGPRPQSTQIDALQGSWTESGGSKKQWLVKGCTVTALTSGGQMGRKFTVREGDDGIVEWGTFGKYFLDRRFGFGMETAVWRLKSPDGPDAFSWRCEKTSSSGDQARLAGHGPTAHKKGQISSTKGKNKGKGKGKAEGPWPQSAQIDALQGHWREVGGSKKQWLIKGCTVTALTSGGHMGRKFTVREGADGNVEWGTYGKYFLDQRFGFGMEIAVWRLRSPDGPEAFSWRIVKMPPSDCQAGSSAGHAPAEGHLELSSLHQRRIDPADGWAYTWPEMRARYAGEYTKQESETYWEACKVVKPPEEMQVERRVDPDNGNIYTWKEVAAHYGSEFLVQEIREYWDRCKVVTRAIPERHIDPADGMPYSWREMKAFYANDYTLPATVAYWDACKKEDAYGQ